jgi:probable biosynthetic protein (TIGR04098 family)
MLDVAVARYYHEDLPASSVYRTATITPAMSGSNSLFMAQVGDWTWEAVSAVSGTNVLTARNATGAPTYLAFYYFHIKASASMHLGSLTFGDHIDVTSTLFNFGSESILTLHKIQPASAGVPSFAPVDYTEFYEKPDHECIYVENFNRWVARSRENSNEDLVKSSPVNFKYMHLPVLPDQYSPRAVYNYARSHNTFLDRSSSIYSSIQDEFCTEYRIDISRDINAVGLIYFAAYFAIIDWAVLQLWRHLGRSDESFLKRIILDQKLCYLGNADIHAVLALRIQRWAHQQDPHREVFNVVIQDRAGLRLIAVSTIELMTEGK